MTQEELDEQDARTLEAIAKRYKVSEDEVELATRVLMCIFNPNHHTAQILRTIAEALDAEIGVPAHLRTNNDSTVKH